MCLLQLQLQAGSTTYTQHTQHRTQSLRDSWFPRHNTTHDYGSGGRYCSLMRAGAKEDKLDEPSRASLLVSHHCRCDPKLPCKAAEDIADACAARGEIPFEE